MKILVTGAKGFVGKNLCAQLNNIKSGKAKCYGNMTVSQVYEYDIDSTLEQLDSYCKEADFVFNLAGVNRPQNPEAVSYTHLVRQKYSYQKCQDDGRTEIIIPNIIFVP